MSCLFSPLRNTQLLRSSSVFAGLSTTLWHAFTYKPSSPQKPSQAGPRTVGAALKNSVSVYFPSQTSRPSAHLPRNFCLSALHSFSLRLQSRPAHCFGSRRVSPPKSLSWTCDLWAPTHASNGTRVRFHTHILVRDFIPRKAKNCWTWLILFTKVLGANLISTHLQKQCSTLWNSPWLMCLYHKIRREMGLSLK